MGLLPRTTPSSVLPVGCVSRSLSGSVLFVDSALCILMSSILLVGSASRGSRSAFIASNQTNPTRQPRGSTRGLSGDLWERGDERFGKISGESFVKLLPNTLDTLRGSIGLAETALGSPGQHRAGRSRRLGSIVDGVRIYRLSGPLTRNYLSIFMENHSTPTLHNF